MRIPADARLANSKSRQKSFPTSRVQGSQAAATATPAQAGGEFQEEEPGALLQPWLAILFLTCISDLM